MSSYHTREAWERRLEERFANPITPSPLSVFYHLALLPGWEAIVGEQLDLLRFCGLTEVRAVCLGSDEDVATVSGMARDRSIHVRIEYTSPDFEEFEHPTLRRLWLAACARPEGAILYFHTKGVSDPASERQKRWRRAMQRYLVADWRDNLRLLASYDMVGANWQELPRFAHFQGNFWMARAEWLANLEDPEPYRAAG